MFVSCQIYLTFYIAGILPAFLLEESLAIDVMRLQIGL
jgi:hypothetical protein